MTPEEAELITQLRPVTANPNLLAQGRNMRALDRRIFLDNEPSQPPQGPIPMEGRDTFLPFRYDPQTGARSLAVPGVIAGMGNTVTAPGRAFSGGEVGPTEGVEFAMNMLGGGAGVAPASRGGIAGTMTKANTKISPEGQLVLDRLRNREGRTGDVATVMGDIQSQNLSPKVLAKRDEMMRQSPTAAEVLTYAQPRQIEKAVAQPGKTIAKYEQDWPTLPSTDELVTVARAGAPNRGWYEGAEKTIEAMFPETPKEQTRFGKGMSALSPQTSVESNAANTVPSYFAWKRQGMPLDEESIHRILAENVQSKPLIAQGADAERAMSQVRTLGKAMGLTPAELNRNPQALRLALALYEQSGPEAAMEVLKGSVLDAWRGNFVRALRDEPTLSGPKVDSFGANMDPQNPFAGLHITQDTWDAMLKGWLQKRYAGSGFNPKLHDPGYSPGYTIGSAKTAAVADRLGWLPREAQETKWSWTKPVGEGKSGVIVPAEVSRGVPDFQTLLRTPALLEQMPKDVRGRLENFELPARPVAPEFAPGPKEMAQLENAQRRVAEIQALRKKLKLGAYD